MHSTISGGKTPDFNARGYTQIMKEQILKGEENELACMDIIKQLKKVYFFFTTDHTFTKFSKCTSLKVIDLWSTEVFLEHQN